MEITFLVPGTTKAMSPRFTLNEIEHVAEHLRKEGILCVTNLAKAVFLDRTTLFRQMKHCFGKTPEEWVVCYKLSWAAFQLISTKSSIAWIAVNSGYESPQAFAKAFKICYLQTPSKYRDTYSDKVTSVNKK